MVKKTNISKLREIKREHQSKKIGRFLIDVQSANAMLTVYDSLTGKQKAKYGRIINSNLPLASRIAWRMVK